MVPAEQVAVRRAEALAGQAVAVEAVELAVVEPVVPDVEADGNAVEALVGEALFAEEAGLASFGTSVAVEANSPSVAAVGHHDKLVAFPDGAGNAAVGVGIVVGVAENAEAA